MAQIHSRKFEGHFDDERVIQEGVDNYHEEALNFEKKRKELREKIDSFFNDIRRGDENFSWVLSDFLELFLAVQDIFTTDEIREMVEKFYGFSEARDEFEDEEYGMYYQKNRGETLKRWDEIYRLTAIDPPECFTTSDFETNDGFENILHNPDRIAFALYKNDPKKMEEFLENPKLLEPEIFSHDFILKNYSLKKIESILSDYILFGSHPSYSFDRISEKMSKIKKILPDYSFTIETGKAKIFYEKYIPSILRINGEYFSWYTIHSLKRDLEEVYSVLGVSVEEILFDQKLVSEWYVKILNERQKRRYETNAEIALSQVILYIKELEKITRVPFNFSLYRDEIDLYYQQEIKRLDTDEESQYLSSRDSYFLKFLQEIELVEKLTGVKCHRFQDVPFEEKTSEELERFHSMISFEHSNFRYWPIEEIEKIINNVFELEKISHNKIVFTPREVDVLFASLLRYCHCLLGDGSRVSVENLPFFIKKIEMLTSTSFDEYIVKSKTKEEYESIFYRLNDFDKIVEFSQIIFNRKEIRSKIIEFIKYTIQRQSYFLDLVAKLMEKYTVTKKDIGVTHDELALFLEAYLKSSYDLNTLNVILQKFDINEDGVKKIAVKLLCEELTQYYSSDSLSKLRDIKSDFKISNEEISNQVDRSRMLKVLFSRSGEHFETIFYEFLTEEILQSEDSREILRTKFMLEPVEMIVLFLKNESLSKIFQDDPWISGFLQLKKLQDISENQANDPWKLELQPLLKFAMDRNIIDIKNNKDIELLVEYVKRYGMCNLKTVFSLFVACSRAKSWADISEKLVAQCEEYGIKVRKQNEERSWRFVHPKLLLNELDKMVSSFQTELMADKIPENINSTIGSEQFSRILGTTQWGRGDSVVDLVRTWKQTVETQPEAALLPKGYQESSFVCQEISRSVRSVGEEQNVENKLAELFQSKEVQEIYAPLAEAIVVGLDGNISEKYWKTKLDGILIILQQKIDEVEKFLNAAPEQFDLWIEQEQDEKQKTSLVGKKKALSNERGRIGIEKQMFQLVEVSKNITNISFTFESEEDIVKTLEELAPFVDMVAGVSSLFREISAFHLIRTIAHMNWSISLQEVFDSKIDPTPERVAKLNSFLKQYVREHYLQEEQNQEHTSHIPFSSTLRQALERIWKVQESRKGKILLDGLDEKIDKILNGNVEENSRLIKISMVPVAGLLRIYAGDIGDACYTSQHSVLAKNQFPDLHAWIYVTKRGTQQETLCGSMLSIQTVQESGSPTLIARANNPKENFIQGIDSEAFVIASLKEVIETAKRIRLARIEEGEKQGLKNIERRQCVVIPIDKVTASSTNREKVGKTYLRFHGLPKVGLRNQPETNFNFYENWNKTSSRACSVIWEIDKNGNEKFYGRWPE